MPLDLTPYDTRSELAVQHFWETRQEAARRQREGGAADQGERSGVTAGKNMDGFIHLMAELARANGLRDAEVCTNRSLVTLPGYFRPTRTWDLLILHRQHLVAAIEFKSQVGPSFGNNFNNRAEEAIGTATDFWTTYREGALGDQPRPFLGWVMLVEDAPASRAPGTPLTSPHFDVLPEFRGASYLDRYELLCRKLMLENLYTHAALIASPRDRGIEGHFTTMSPTTSPRAFAAAFAGHIATHSAGPSPDHERYQ
jgi:hypothetical protein